MSSESLSTRLQRFAFARLLGPHLTRSRRAFSATLRTPALDRRTLRWFAPSPRRAGTEDHQPQAAGPSISDAALHQLIDLLHRLSFAFVLAHQAEIYLSVAQRKVLQPNDFVDLDALEQRLLAFGRYYEQIATPFEWKLTRHDLHRVLTRLDRNAEHRIELRAA